MRLTDMFARAIVALLALARVAAAYPVVIPKVSEARQRAREAEFQRRNPHTFTAVEAGARGFIKHVRTEDPALVPSVVTSTTGTSRYDDAPMRAFLRANADLFGFAPATVDRLPVGGPNILLVEEFDRSLVELRRSVDPVQHRDIERWRRRRGVDGVDLSDDRATGKRVIGQSYTQTLSYGRSQGLDCAMAEGGKANCKTKTLATRTRTVTLATEDVRATTWHLPQANMIRLVTCVDAYVGIEPDPDPKWIDRWGDISVTSRRFTPQKGAPKLPLVVDAVTGRTVAVTVSSCADPIFVALRDE